MKRVFWLGVLALAIAMMAFLFIGAAKTPTDFRQVYNEGNYKDAFDGLSPLVLSADGTDQLESDFELCVSALQQLGRIDEVDDFREKAIAAHANDWRFLWEAARSYRDVQHYGQIVAGKFTRGNSSRGPAKWVNSFDRDRVRALQLMQQALNAPAANNAVTNDEAKFYDELAGMLLQGMNGPDAWRMQTLTDLTTLPDYDEWQGYWGYGWGGENGPRGAPVDDKGQPIYHAIPKDWPSAKTDGERWRWALERSASYSKADALRVQFEFAQFLNGQFGVQTTAEYGNLFNDRSAADGKKEESRPFAVSTLTEDETIAKLASGIKRFHLPDEFNAIKILQGITNAPNNDSGVVDQAMEMLAQIYEDRQQYDTAVDWWKKDIARFGEGSDQYRRKRLEQIVDNWGMFENTLVQPASDQGATIDFRFRNGSMVSFTANEVDLPALLADVKAYLKNKPQQVDQNRVEIGNIGWRLVEQNEAKYIGKEVAAWDLKLLPRDHHFDKRITVETPLKKAGAYLLVGKMDGGNVSRIIVWVADTVIVRKQLSGAVYTYVADATSGQPIPKATVDFFGYRQEWVNDKKYRVDIQEFSETADGDGQVIVPMAKENSDSAPPPVDPAAPVIGYNFNWVTTATTKDEKGNERFAYMGFAGVWASTYYDAYDSQYNQTKAFVATDRPVYRPGDKVQWKMWVGHNKYDEDGKSPFVGRRLGMEIQSPKGDVIKRINGTLDEWGGLSGEYEVEKDATLGVWTINQANGWGSVQFRVEEYKKPEFEVSVEAPTEPIMLGDKATATIRAKYYFGAPVINAKVKYKVTRTAHDARWYPAGPWDWFYEPGYWWFGCDYPWYPGWERWGCWRPIHGWWPGGWGGREQPEIVSENEVAIGADGTVKVEIDTSLAKAAYGDEDHEYDITAEVTDASRRTIVGTGQVLVAREPFKVYAWVDNGYYGVGDTVQAHFSAQTLDNKPVQGTGTLKLLRVTYDDRAQPVETAVQTWDLPTDAEGQASVQIKAAEAGQYRLSYSVTDGKGRTMEGGYVFVVRGEGFDGKDFRFNDIEVVTDKKEYAAGDKVKLMVNANRADATVLLFVRPTNGVYLTPKVLRLKGKSAVEEVQVGMKDMPNFFVEALTVSDARVHTDVREVIVPPADRVLNVSVTSDAAEYEPGQKATLTLKVTEKNGEPFTGAAVLALYDKSVEYISGGSNVQDIRKYFWQWRRQHYVETQSSLDVTSGNMVRGNEVGMTFLGAFGEMAADDISKDGEVLKSDIRTRHSLSGGGAFAMDEVASKAMPMSAAPSGAVADEASTPALQPAPPPSPQQVEPTVRTNFADTACWSPNLVTAKDGTATVDVTMPESLTTWKAKVWTFGAGSRVGQGETEVVTTKKLIVRLEAPRFFVQTDEVVLSAIVHNYLKSEKRVRVQLEIQGGALVNREGPQSTVGPEGASGQQADIDVPANGEQRVDFWVRAKSEGTAVVRMKALTDEESDATQMSFPVYVHGMLKTDSFSGAIRGDASNTSVTIKVPKERRPDQSRLEIRYSPTLAGAMVDALPYLVDYPYGCTEQTLNRFVPTVITQKVLLDMHLDLAAIEKKRTNLNAQEIGNDAQRATEWKHFDRNPVFDKEEVARMVREGVTRLSNMQLSDGGWGWFSGTGEQSYPHTTAVVVHGLQVARDNGAKVDAAVLDRGIEWLVKFQKDRVAWIKEKRTERTADDLDAFVYMVLVDADHDNTEMRKLLYEDRNGLGVYAKAMFGLALSTVKDQTRLNMILDNLRQYVVQDDEDQTAYLKMPDSGWWYWYDSEFEADAYYLKLLARTDPKGQVASRLAKYLINNRRHGCYWNSTRDTALCIEALAEYVRGSDEAAPDMTVHIALDGRELKQVKIDAENLFTYDNKVMLTGADVPDGSHTIQVSREGTGPLYFNAYLTNFTLETPIRAAGLEIKVNRKVYLLTEADKTMKAEGAHGQAVDERVEKYVRTELMDGQSVKSGDLVEVELGVDSKNDYEYILLEDMKAAGFEPVEVRSGYNGNDMDAYVEFHDERVAFFVRWLSRGKHSVSYRLRAEVPGTFSALPAKASAMYAPELKANSDEIRLQIVDAPSVIQR